MKTKTKFKETEIGMIPEDWKIMKVDDIKSSKKYAIAIGPFGSRMKSNLYTLSGVPIIRGNNMSDTKFLEGNFVYVSEETANTLRSSNVFPDDLVFPHRGLIGKVTIVPKDGPKRYMLSTAMMKLTCNTDLVEPLFMFYFFKSEKGRNELLKNESTVGVPGIGTPLTTLKSIEVPIPSISEQRVIAHMLSIIDDKIKLNVQMNNTLEEIGKTAFKHWFVDFEFPNEKGEPYKSSGGDMEYNEEIKKKIPRKWELKSIGDVVTVKGGTTPSTTNVEYWNNGKINWCTPKDLSRLNSTVLLDTERKITEKGLSVISSDLLPIGTVLLSSRAPIGYLAISEIPVSINQGFIAIVCNKVISKYFMLFWLQHNMDEIKNRAHGTTFEEINKTSFRNIRIIIPPTYIVDNYDKLMHALYDKIVKNEKEIKTLTSIRDSLLPKLMSGKIRVPVEVR